MVWPLEAGHSRHRHHDHPVLYAGTFLWAFWDPYDHLDRLPVPVAVVNLDTGSTLNGKSVNVGSDLVKSL